MTHTYYDAHRRLRVQTHSYHSTNTHSTTMDEKHHNTAHEERTATTETTDKSPATPSDSISLTQRETTNRPDRRGRGSVTEAVRGRLREFMFGGARVPISDGRPTATPCAPSTAYAYMSLSGNTPHGSEGCSTTRLDNLTYLESWDQKPLRHAIRFVDGGRSERPSLTETRNSGRRDTGDPPERVRSQKSEIAGGVGVFPSEGSASNGGVAA